MMEPVYYRGENDAALEWRVTKVIDGKEVTVSLNFKDAEWGPWANTIAAEYLAAEILTDVCGEYVGERYAFDFMVDVLKMLPSDGFQITAEQIEKWVEEREEWIPF